MIFAFKNSFIQPLYYMRKEYELITANIFFILISNSELKFLEIWSSESLCFLLLFHHFDNRVENGLMMESPP